MIALREIDLSDWSRLRDACGEAGHVADSLRKLLRAATPEEAEAIYWELENHVVVQGQLFQSALAVVPVLLAALVDPSPRHVRVSVMELLFQIVSGVPHVSEVELGNVSLGEDCRQIAREGKWLLIRELIHGVSNSARDVLQVIEENNERIRVFGAS